MFQINKTVRNSENICSKTSENMRIIFSVIEIRTMLVKNHVFVGESIERTVLHFLETYNSYDKFHYLFAIHSVGWNTIESDGFLRVLLNSSVEAIFDRNVIYD